MSQESSAVTRYHINASKTIGAFLVHPSSTQPVCHHDFVAFYEEADGNCDKYVIWVATEGEANGKSYSRGCVNPGDNCAVSIQLLEGSNPLGGAQACLLAPTVDATDPENPIITLNFEKADGTVENFPFTFNIPAPVSSFDSIDLLFDPLNPLALIVNATYTDDAGTTVTVTDSTPVDLSAFVSGFTQTIIGGNQIGEHTANGTSTPIYETITTIVNNGGNNWSFTNENGDVEILEVLCEGPCPWEPISSAGGTLSDGTTYTVVTAAATLNDNGDGSIQHGTIGPNEDLLTVTFSQPVDFKLTNATFTASGIWQTIGTRINAATTDGTDWCYTPGTFSLPGGFIDVVGQVATGTAAQGNAVTAQDDWGQLDSLNVTTITVNAVTFDTYMYLARPANSRCEQPICDVLDSVQKDLRKLQEVPSEAITTIVDNGDNNWTYTNEAGDAQILEVLCEGPCPWEPLSLGGGTLSDGVTTYTFTPDPAAATNDNGDGSISWGVTPLQTTMTLSFSGPVDFHLSPATFANSAIWHVSGGRTSAARTLDGTDWCYIVGTVDAQIDVQGGDAIATYVGPPNINAQQDWGTLTSLNVQNLEFDANINDTYRFQARPANSICEQPICDVIDGLNTNVRKMLEEPAPSTQAFQVEAAKIPGATAGDTAISIQPTIYNAIAPIVWSLDSATGDVLNVVVDPSTGEVTYDYPATLSTPPEALIIISATDASGNIVTKEICLDASKYIIETCGLDDLEARFQFADNAVNITDSTGNLTTVKVGAGGSYTTDAVADSAYDFDGNVYFESAQDPLDGKDSYTIEAWVKADNNTDTNAGVFSRWANSTATLVSLEQSGGFWSFTVSGQGISSAGSPQGAVTPGVYQHIVATNNNGLLSLYVDGVLTNTATSALFAPNTGTSTFIGNELGFAGRNFTGLIDEVRVLCCDYNQTEVSDSLTTGPVDPVSTGAQYGCESIDISLPANTPITLTTTSITSICNWNIIEQITLEEVVVKVIRSTNNTLILEANSAVDITVFVGGII